MKKLLCTLGPASLNKTIIQRLEGLGASLFRINLSHTPLKEVEKTIRLIQGYTSVPICLDTEGAQIRTGNFVDQDIYFRPNTNVHAHIRPVPGNNQEFNFTPPEIIRELMVGDFISIDFNAVLVQVTGLDEEGAVLRILNGGTVGRNKAVTVDRDIEMPPLTEKDKASIAIGRDLGLSHFALSFANGSDDVAEMRQLIGDDGYLISKVESRGGLQNLEDIAKSSDAVLIDRGDLSRQIPIELIPKIQKHIIKTVRGLGTEVFVATNLLESMVTQPGPTRAEVNDIYNTLLDGADGLVLAAETAIGEYPVRCAEMVFKMMASIDHKLDDLSGSLTEIASSSMLVAPHGGQLQTYEKTALEDASLDGLPRLKVSDAALMDCEHLTEGTYSPLGGFMTKEEIESVLEKNMLPDGTIWTMPIVLQAQADQIVDFGVGTRVVIQDAGGQGRFVIDVSEIFQPDMAAACRRWFNTDSSAHPGVRRVMKNGPVFIAGEITPLKYARSSSHHFELTPSQTRFIFEHRGWSKIVAFHGRNPIHRGHEEIQKRALESTGADGLFINPVIGAKKPGDFLPHPIILSYQVSLDFGFLPKDKTLFSSFTTYSRYAGPREAVFTALCRRNMGCSHFIIGRDHTGVGDFYEPDANGRMFEDLAKVGDIGIEPVFFDAIGYNSENDTYEAESDKGNWQSISGTKIRDSLRDGVPIADWMMRDEVQNALRQELLSGAPMFVE